MATRLGTLRDDDVGAHLYRPFDVIKVLALANEQGASVFGLLGEGRWIAERQHHRGRTEFERLGHHAGRALRRPRDEADADSLITGGRELRTDPIGVAVAPADEAQPAGPTDRRGQGTARGQCHGRRDDRMLNPEAIGQASGDHLPIIGVRGAIARGGLRGKTPGEFKVLVQQRVDRTGWTVVRRGVGRVFSSRGFCVGGC